MLISELQSSPSMTMVRYFLEGIPGEVVSYSLHGFCDTSKYAYAAVVYLVIKTRSGVFTRFVASKTRVSPLKSQSIPRLELLSAFLLARLMHNVSRSLEPELASLLHQLEGGTLLDCGDGQDVETVCAAWRLGDPHVTTE